MGNLFGSTKSTVSQSVCAVPQLLQDPVPEHCIVGFEGITIDTLWKNIPSPDTNVYWLFSTKTGRGSYYFMSARDSSTLEQAYRAGARSCMLDQHNVTVDFSNSTQSSTCGGIVRAVRRLPAEDYEALKAQYLQFYRTRTYLWCVKCRNGYILYSPKLQEILDEAWERRQSCTVSLSGEYEYYIDVTRGLQINSMTSKERPIVRLLCGNNRQPIYGSFGVVFPANEGATEDETSVSILYGEAPSTPPVSLVLK